MAQTVSAEGTLEPAQTDDLSFGAAGTVTAVNVEAGDRVRAGRVLATMDSAELELDVANAESSLAEAQATWPRTKTPMRPTTSSRPTAPRWPPRRTPWTSLGRTSTALAWSRPSTESSRPSTSSRANS